MRHKKRICMYLSIIFLLNLINLQIVFSQEDISISESHTEINKTVNSEYISEEIPEISETEAAENIEATETAAESETPSEEIIADSLESEETRDESSTIDDNQYMIIPLGENEFLASGIKTRDLEVSVTDGYDFIFTSGKWIFIWNLL